jgi:hypothetical protein
LGALRHRLSKRQQLTGCWGGTGRGDSRTMKARDGAMGNHYTWRRPFLDSGPCDEQRSWGNQPPHISLTNGRALAHPCRPSSR